jgi:hypothetical protein
MFIHIIGNKKFNRVTHVHNVYLFYVVSCVAVTFASKDRKKLHTYISYGRSVFGLIFKSFRNWVPHHTYVHYVFFMAVFF